MNPVLRTPSPIVIIENDPGNRFLLERILSAYGYLYRSFAGGQDALQLIATEAAALVLTDVQMPDLDGYQIATLIRRTPLNATVPIIAISGFTRETDRQRALHEGCTEVLAKPYHPQELIALVTRYLSTSYTLAG